LGGPRLVRCTHCGYALIGERQKGYVYYRCHTAECPTRGIREEQLHAAVQAALKPLRFRDGDLDEIAQEVRDAIGRDTEERSRRLDVARLQLGRLAERLQRLTDLYLDQGIERADFEQRKTALLVERRALDLQLATVSTEDRSVEECLQEFLELAASAYSLYERADPAEKRELLQICARHAIVITCSTPS